MSNWQFTEQHYNLLLTEIKSVQDRQDTGFKEVKDRQDIANGRTRKLENWRNYLLGAWAVLSFFALVMYDKFKSMLEAIAQVRP